MMELYITIVYTMIVQVAQKQWLGKKLFLIKTARKGEVKFSIMSLEEPQEVNAEGLELASIKFNIEIRFKY